LKIPEPRRAAPVAGEQPLSRSATAPLVSAVLSKRKTIGKFCGRGAAAFRRNFRVKSLHSKYSRMILSRYTERATFWGCTLPSLCRKPPAAACQVSATLFPKKTSAGVSQAKHFRGLLFKRFTTSSTSS